MRQEPDNQLIQKGISTDPESKKQEALLDAFVGTTQHFFGGWPRIFSGVKDARHPDWLIYPLEALLCAGALMFTFRWGSRRQINHQWRGNELSQAKFEGWFDVENIPHGDTLNYGFKGLDADEMQESVCRMVEKLIRKKVLYRWRLCDNFLIAVDGTGMLTFRERHCEYCLTKKLRNGETRYYHPVLAAKLVTANGFAFSIMTEFIENTDPQASKQDCELKAFYRLAERLKKRFPRLPICLLLEGLFAGGPTFQLCEDYHWRYLIVLQDDDLPNVHRSYDLVLPLVPENHKRLLWGPRQAIIQDYRWVTPIEYLESKQRTPGLHVLACEETQPNRQGSTRTTTHKWLTNFIPTWTNVDTLAHQGGRLRWKIENEGFNVQKNGGFNLEHPYRQDGTARKVFYFLLQIAHIIFQLIEKGSLFRNAFPNGVGALKNIAFRLLEAWRNLRLSPSGFRSLYKGRYYIRFDSSSHVPTGLFHFEVSTCALGLCQLLLLVIWACRLVYFTRFCPSSCFFTMHEAYLSLSGSSRRADCFATHCYPLFVP